MHLHDADRPEISPSEDPYVSTDADSDVADRDPRWAHAPLALRRRFAILNARVEGERHAFFARGGECARCRDTGRDRGTNECCPDCARGRLRLVEQRHALFRARCAEANLAPFAGRTLQSWPGPPALTDALATWHNGWPVWEGVQRPFLLLHGPTGNGKSSLAAALLRDAMLQTGRDGWRCVVPELLRRLRPVEDRDDTLAVRAARVPLLILDDIGVDRPTDWVEAQLYTIINERYEHRRWTVITANDSPDDGSLAERLGPRIYWRIHELALAIQVPDRNLRDQ